MYIFKQKFKCEDLEVALKVLSKGFYLFQFDLKSDYHHVEIFSRPRKVLGFFLGFWQRGIETFSICSITFWFVIRSLFVY